MHSYFIQCRGREEPGRWGFFFGILGPSQPGWLQLGSSLSGELQARVAGPGGPRNGSELIFLLLLSRYRCLLVGEVSGCESKERAEAT